MNIRYTTWGLTKLKKFKSLSTSSDAHPLPNNNNWTLPPLVPFTLYYSVSDCRIQKPLSNIILTKKNVKRGESVFQSQSLHWKQLFGFSNFLEKLMFYVEKQNNEKSVHNRRVLVVNIKGTSQPRVSDNNIHNA